VVAGGEAALLDPMNGPQATLLNHCSVEAALLNRVIKRKQGSKSFY
jgi:hypothetical protein